MLPPGAMPIVPAMAGPEVGEDVAEQVRADDDVEPVGMRTKCAVRMSMWYWSVLTSGIVLRHRGEALVPERHACG